MVVTSQIASIGIIVFSLIIGLITYYVMSNTSKEEKKKQLEELISQIISFVILIWLSKILLNLSTFVKDPLPVLAYPSDSNAFYLAVLLMAVVFAYKSILKKAKLMSTLGSFLPVFLVGSFAYEFIQFIWGDNIYAFGYLLLLFVLLVAFFFLHDRITTEKLLFVILSGWSIGLIGLSIAQPFVTVFGYIMETWFISLFYLITALTILVVNRKWGS